MKTTLIISGILILIALALVVANNWKAIKAKLFGTPKVQFIVSTTPTVIPPDGSFVKGNDNTVDNTLYYISGGSKHAVSLIEWELHRYPTYIIIDSATLAAYPTGTNY